MRIEIFLIIFINYEIFMFIEKKYNLRNLICMFKSSFSLKVKLITNHDLKSYLKQAQNLK